MLPDFKCHNALFLQGPAGPFMRRLGSELTANGLNVTKVNFHAGDKLFSIGMNTVAFRQERGEWKGFLRALIAERAIDGLFLFGDSRPLHRDASEVAKELGIPVWVLEEGYLRPNWITFEEGGVNGHSALPRDPEVYERASLPPVPPPEPIDPRSFQMNVGYSILNALAFTILKRRYPKYEHHRPLNAWRHALWWTRGTVQKPYFSHKERHDMEGFTGALSGNFYFVPLQVHCDFQLLHSPYDEVLDFAREVVESFARDADPSVSLVFKHHPMDRAYREYTAFFNGLREEFKLEGRLFYVHDLHLPTLLLHARGTITINSTVGLSSIHHGTPVITLGTAVYDMPGLTYQGTLSSFLRDVGPEPSKSLYECFRRWLLHRNQANGSFYTRLPGHERHTGLRWFDSPDDTNSEPV